MRIAEALLLVGLWRMPTDAEFAALTNNCTSTWVTTNGVSGRLVAGKGAYADRSIFLPAANTGCPSAPCGTPTSARSKNMI